MIQDQVNSLQSTEQKDQIQKEVASKISVELETHIMRASDSAKDTIVEDYFRNIDQRVNLKIAASMKKAVHLLVEKFDILIQNRFELILSKQVQDEVDKKLRTFKLQSSPKALCAKCKSLARRDALLQPKNCINCNSDIKKKSPTAKQIRFKVQERVERSIEHHQVRLQSPRARYGNKYPYKSPNRFFESQESSIRSLEQLQYSQESNAANFQSRSPNRHKCSSPIADASFCSSDKACPHSKKGVPHLEHNYHHHHHILPCGGIIVEKCQKRPKTYRQNPSNEKKKKSLSKESKRTVSKERETKLKKLKNSDNVPRLQKVNQLQSHQKSKNNQGVGHKTTRQVESNITKRQREAKMRRNASKASLGDSQPRQTPQKKGNDALKQKQDDFIQKLPIGYPMELKEDLIDTRLKWVNNNQQVSALFDEIEDIYLEADPIDESLELRKKYNGFINNYSVVRSKKKEKRKFFFYLRYKLPEQSSLFEVSPVQILNQLSSTQRGEAIMVFDDNDRTNPNIMVPQSSGSSSRVKISGSLSTQKIDRSGLGSIISQQDVSVNKEYSVPKSQHPAQTFTDSRKYSDSENIEKQPSLIVDKRKQDQLIKSSFSPDYNQNDVQNSIKVNYHAKSNPCSPSHISKQSVQVLEKGSPEKLIILNQSSQEALIDIQLHRSVQISENKAEIQSIIKQQKPSSPQNQQIKKSEHQNLKTEEQLIEEVQQKQAEESGIITQSSPCLKLMQAVYSPQKHKQMLHTLVQQQSPEKIHFETFQKKPESLANIKFTSSDEALTPNQIDQPHLIQFQMCPMALPEMTVVSPQNSPPKYKNEQPNAHLKGSVIQQTLKVDDNSEGNIQEESPQKKPMESPERELPPKPEMISESLPESPQKPPHHMNELIELERDLGFQFYSQDFSMDISQDKLESQTPLNIYKMRSPLLNQEPPSQSPQKAEVCEESAPNSQGQVLTAQSVQEQIDKKLEMAEQKEIELSQNIKDSSIQKQTSNSDQSLQRQQTIQSQKSQKFSNKEFCSNNSSSDQNNKNISTQPKLIKMVTCMDSLTPINSNSHQSRIPSIRKSNIQQLERRNSSLNKLSMKQSSSKISSNNDQNQSNQSQKIMFSVDNQVQILNDDQSAFEQMQNQKDQSQSHITSQKSNMRNTEQNQTYPKINATKKIFNYSSSNMDQLNMQSKKQSEKGERLEYERIINVQAEDTEIADECDLNSQMSVRINISALDIDDQTKYLEELQNVQTTKQRKRSDSKESEVDKQDNTQSRSVKQSADQPGIEQSPIKIQNNQRSNQYSPSIQNNQPVKQQKAGVLNTIQALEQVLNQVKAKHGAHNNQLSNRHQKSASTIDNTQGAQENQTVTSNTQHHQTQPSNLLLLSQPTIVCSPKAFDKTHTQQAAPPAQPDASEQEDFEELKQHCEQSKSEQYHSDTSQQIQNQDKSSNLFNQKSQEEQENSSIQQDSTPTQIMGQDEKQSRSIRSKQQQSLQRDQVCQSETNHSNKNLLSSISKIKITDNSEPFKQVASDNFKSQNELDDTTNKDLIQEQEQIMHGDPQLQKMMEQFVEEVVVENSVDNQKKCRQLSQTQMGTRYINEIEIDKAINEILENSSFHFNKNEVVPNQQEQKSALEFEMSLANKTQPEKYNKQNNCESSISQPFRVDQLEDIRIDKVLNDYGPSSGIESIYRELEKAKLLVETSPRKIQGEHLITFEQQQHHQSTETIPENMKTSPRVYQNDKINKTENQQKSLHNHSRKATPLVGGNLAPGFDSMINLKKVDDTTQKTSEDMKPNSDILQILQKNSFLKDFDIETILKLTGELQKVTYKKNEQIVRFGEISQNFYILHKGKIKVTEYEPKSSPQDQNLEDKITMVKYINKQGFGFGEESVKNFTPHKTSIEAIDNCEFYVIDGFYINEILSRVSQERNSSEKYLENRQKVKKNIHKDLDKMSSDEQPRTDSSVHLRFDILQPNLNFLPESFVTESKSSRHRIRAASYCPCRVYHDHHESDDLLNCNLSAIQQKEQPSVCASQSSMGQNLKDLTYASFIENSQIFGLNLRELSIFGDRAPEGHQKIRIIQKGLSQLYWLTASTNSQNQVSYFICSQIPRAISTQFQKAKMIQVEQDFYNQIKTRKDIMRNIFSLESVQQQTTLKDTWKIYKTDQRRDIFKTFQETLFNVTFDQQVAITKVVDVQHSYFYEMISQKKGMRHIAKLVRKVCDFLQLLHDQGIVYGNLRAENIMIKLDDDNKEIQQIKFIDFGSVTKMDKAFEMLIPDKIEHCPPDLLKNLIEIEKFQKSQNKLIPEHLRLCKRRINEISESIDVYSLGILLLQIVIGCPLQQQLPLRFKYKTVKGHQYVCQPLLGTIPQQVHLNNVDVKNLISIQENFAQNLNFYMQKSDPYRLLQDADLLRLIQSMVNKDHTKRPTVRMILHDKFLKKWLKVA